MTALHITEQQALQMADNIMLRCDVLATISQHATELTRIYLSNEHAKANQQVAKWMEQAGMTVWQDAVGNICGRYEGNQPGLPALLLGSHLDTVKNAGRYDGILGVITAIEVVNFLQQQQVRLAMAIEIVGFADEEGTRFGVTLLGSHALTGNWSQSWLAVEDEHHITMDNAMHHFGLDPELIVQAQRPVASILAYLELHIEQGPCLEAAQLAVGVVTAINGARRLIIKLTGHAGHAGTVPMGQRADALAGSAEWIAAVERLTIKAANNLVATVGQINCKPNAVNVIAGEVELTLDIRGPQDEAVDTLLDLLLAEGSQIALQRGLSFEAHEYYRIKATPCDIGLQACLTEAVTQVQGRSISLPSGAGHDAIAMAHNWPIGMLFVRCYKGISHHPRESVNQQDVAIAIQCYIRAVMTINPAML